ncbi:uncharacterized protein LOC119112558 [Pollicipes pollicipes]|uniref:uncharacterized protein LOC119112558 n=1 Tax=Pollicipes pollicipes TaxID=41117 RepID=UPI00188512FF|nr:uncharacterized protein LOC119112558 [Pollicipes pollicipes]XP_037092669.1 uncharacterized protein LOC119112558 [Pollicipes pollicipes]
MSASAQLSVVGCQLLLVVAALAVCGTAYNDDRPIFKWSPNFFNSHYRRSMYKRFNEDQPFYKWSPRWFQQYGGTFKRSVAAPVPSGGDLRGKMVCGAAGATCQPGLFGCCPGLQCLPTAGEPRCQEANGLSGDLSNFADEFGPNEAEQVIPELPTKSFWGRSGPPPFFPRSWA